MNRLTITEISKKIKKKEVLNNISFELCGSQITGVVGENGSGKTTLFRIISGLVTPSSGYLSWNGEKISRHKDAPRIGIVLDNVSLFPELSALQNLMLLSRINSIVTMQEVREVISLVGLDPDNPLHFSKFSLGMKQRLLLAQAIMEKPDILLLDEATNGIDADGLELYYKIIKSEAQRGAIVFLSSHRAVDIARLCDTVIYTRQGEILDEQ